MEGNNTLKYGHTLQRQLSTLKLASRLLSHELHSQGGAKSITLTRDITELKSAEARRRESETRYRIVSQMSSDLIFEVDEQGRQAYVAPGSEAVIGYSPEELEAFEYSITDAGNVAVANYDSVADFDAALDMNRR